MPPGYGLEIYYIGYNYVLPRWLLRAFVTCACLASLSFEVSLSSKLKMVAFGGDNFDDTGPFEFHVFESGLVSYPYLCSSRAGGAPFT